MTTEVLKEKLARYLSSHSCLQKRQIQTGYPVLWIIKTASSKEKERVENGIMAENT
jgi:hypothetical protein